MLRLPPSPGVTDRRVKSFRASTRAARELRKAPGHLGLTVFAATHASILLRDEEQIFNLSIAEASKDYGPKPVEDAIRSEISSLITDTGALEPCRTSGQQLPLHLIFGHKFDADGRIPRLRRGLSLKETYSIEMKTWIPLLFAYEFNPSSCCLKLRVIEYLLLSFCPALLLVLVV